MRPGISKGRSVPFVHCTLQMHFPHATICCWAAQSQCFYLHLNLLTPVFWLPNLKCFCLHIDLPTLVPFVVVIIKGGSIQVFGLCWDAFRVEYSLCRMNLDRGCPCLYTGINLTNFHLKLSASDTDWFSWWLCHTVCYSDRKFSHKWPDIPTMTSPTVDLCQVRSLMENQHKLSKHFHTWDCDGIKTSEIF